MFTIGEFSKISGLTVKALRFYHEEGLFSPACVDPGTGYRHYKAEQVETARAIRFLRELEFPLADIKMLLAERGEGTEPLEVLERHKATIDQKARHLRKVARSLERFILEEREAKAMSRQQTFEVQEKALEPVLVAGVRMKGRYSDCGKGFGRVGKALGRYICGKPLLLHYDHEYKEEDADFEACFPVRASRAVDGVSVRELPGGRCVSLLHKGPYEQLGHSYAKVLQHVKDKGYAVLSPTREVYHKGPGMIFKGNPKNYLTEIQIPVDADGRSGECDR
jgi:DNA-binding transcriptional MerR regulator